MTIIAPDPHPGRCCNYRMRGIEHVRCLDYENVEHVCTFPKPPPTYAGFDGNTYSLQSSVPPKPWVKP